MLSDMMTPEQVAGYLQLSKDTIYRLIRQKKLAATRIGRAYRVPHQDLEAFIAANSTRSEVRHSLFKRVLAIAGRAPDLDGDALLNQLEGADSRRSPVHTP
jgi:excisionase family DNA binding protein